MKNILFAIFMTVILHFSNADGVNPPITVPTVPAAPVVPPAPVAAAAGPLPPFSYINRSKVMCNYNGKPSPNRADKYSLVDVDTSLCSHVIYNCASLDPSTLTVRLDSIGPDFESVLFLKQKGIIVMLSVGCSYDFQTSEKYSRMVNDGVARSQFVATTVSLMKQLKINGLNINWNFPTCWDGYCAKNHGRQADKVNFINLLRELHVAFRYYKFELMVSVSPLDTIADKAYFVSEVANNVDFINLQTYDLNNQTYSVTTLHSAFQGNPISTVHTVDYWRFKGAPVEKLIVGVPTFGRTFSLAKDTWNMVGSPASMGKTTSINIPGMAAYFEVCTGLDYQFVENVGAYAYKGDQWVSFDDVSTMKIKGDYIRKNKLAGVFISSLDTDDYSGGMCGQGKYPLIRSLRLGLGL